MYCPRCGAPNEEGAKFCASCGAEQPAAGEPTQKPKRSFGENLGDIFGRSPRARLLTLGTIAALLIAVIGFVVLPAADDDDSAESIPQDSYTREADQLCLGQKRAIVNAGRQALGSGDDDQLAAYAAALVPIAIEWRTALTNLPPPADRVVLAEELSFALRGVAVEAGALARVARGGSSTETVTQANEVDEATSQVEDSVAAMGLNRCAGISIALTPEEPN